MNKIEINTSLTFLDNNLHLFGLKFPSGHELFSDRYFYCPYRIYVD